MVQLAMSFIEKLPTEEQRLSLIKTIRDVCEKKIYLEVRVKTHLNLSCPGRIRQMLFVVGQAEWER